MKTLNKEEIKESLLILEKAIKNKVEKNKIKKEKEQLKKDKDKLKQDKDKLKTNEVLESISQIELVNSSKYPQNTSISTTQSPSIIDRRLFEITKQFLIKKKLVVYGGTAINALLKPQDKFYTKEDKPDYDFYSENAREHAKELADIYLKEGYTDIQAKEAVHVGTFKVFVNREPVADITYLPFQLMSIIRSTSRMGNEGFLCVSPNFLRIGMYLELSRPNGYIERWSKVFERLSLLNSTYPIHVNNMECDNKNKLMIDDKNKKEIIDNAFEYLKGNKEIILIGSMAVNIYKKKELNKKGDDFFYLNNPRNISYYDLISVNLEKTLEEVLRIFDQTYNLPQELLEKKDIKDFNNNKEYTIKNTKYEILYKKHLGIGELSEYIPEHYIVNINGFNLMTIYKSEACYSYHRFRKINVGTIDTMLSFYFSFLMANRHYYVRDRILCLCNYLIELQAKQWKTNRPLLKRFTLQCIGYQYTLDDFKKMRKEKMKRLKRRAWYYKPK